RARLLDGTAAVRQSRELSAAADWILRNRSMPCRSGDTFALCANGGLVGSDQVGLARRRRIRRNECGLLLLELVLCDPSLLLGAAVPASVLGDVYLVAISLALEGVAVGPLIGPRAERLGMRLGELGNALFLVGFERANALCIVRRDLLGAIQMHDG